MKEPDPLDISFPMQGLHVASAIANQPSGTTPSMLNCRKYNPRLGRDQGGQRAGQSKYMPLQVNGAALVQEVSSCVSTNVAVSTAAFVGAIALERTTSVGMEVYNNGGVNRFFDTSDKCLGSCWDNDNGIAFGAMSTGTATKITAGKPDGTIVWTSANLTQFHASAQVGMAFGGGFVWVATQNSGATATYVYQLNATTGAIVGAAHVYTTSRILSNGAVAYWNGILAIGMSTGFVEYLNTNTLVSTAVQISAFQIGDIDVDGSGFFYYSQINAGPTAFVTKTDAFGNLAWSSAGASATGGFQPGCCYDPINNVVAMAYKTSGTNFGSVATFNVSTGVLITSFRVFASTNCYAVRPSGTGGYAVNTDAASNVGTVSAAGVTVWQAAVAIPTGTPRALSVYQGPSVSTAKNLALHYVRGISVAGGTVVRLASGIGPITLTGGAAALSAGATVIYSAQQGQALYFADGVNFKYYNGLTDSVVALTASSGSLPVDNQGNAPRLVIVWRNRLVFSGLRFDPLNWFMSAVGDPTNWNYAPSPQVETEAVAGNNATAGQSPDIINCLIPYNDEILIFLCDNSIWQMTGDPMAGGRLDLVCGGVGGAFGRPWCRDGQGAIYFCSSRGSVYKMMPGGIPERLSDPIAELLLTIQTGTNSIRMEWDERQFGFHLFVTPTVAAATFHYFYDARPNRDGIGSWWQDQHANTNHDPIATYALSGDTPGERVILLGGRDGYIRFLDVNAKDDDGTAINSYAFLGPIRNPGMAGLTLADLQCSLDVTSSPVNYAVYAGYDPQSALSGGTDAVGTFNISRNRSQPVRVFGHSLWVQLSGRNAVGEAWALEWLKGRVRIPEGRTRQRVF